MSSADGTRLYWRSWRRPGHQLALAVIPGLGEHSGRYSALARGMARFGIEVAAVDLRGHGRSEGARGHVDHWSQWVDDAAGFVDMLAAEGTRPVVPLGHSFGGVVLLSAVLHRRLRPARFVLSSPALRLRMAAPRWKILLGQVTSRTLPRLTFDNEVDPAAISRLPEVVDAYRSDLQVHRSISSRTYTEWRRAAEEGLSRAEEIDVPFFASHGSADPLIDPVGTEELVRRARVPGRELRLYPGRLHEPFNDSGNEEVFADLACWLGLPA